MNLALNINSLDSLKSEKVEAFGYRYESLINEIEKFLKSKQYKKVYISSKISYRYEKLIEQLNDNFEVDVIDNYDDFEINLNSFKNIALFIEAIDDDIFYKNAIKTLSEKNRSIDFIVDFDLAEPIYADNIFGFSDREKVILDKNSPKIEIKKYAFQEYKIEKMKTINYLKELFRDDIRVLEIDNLDNSIGIFLKNIRVRDLINTLELENISVLNSTRCYLKTKKPSKTLMALNLSEDEAREFLSLSFMQNFDELKSSIDRIHFKYRQIRAIKD